MTLFLTSNHLQRHPVAWWLSFFNNDSGTIHTSCLFFLCWVSEWSFAKLRPYQNLSIPNSYNIPRKLMSSPQVVDLTVRNILAKTKRKKGSRMKNQISKYSSLLMLYKLILFIQVHIETLSRMGLYKYLWRMEEVWPGCATRQSYEIPTHTATLFYSGHW